MAIFNSYVKLPEGKWVVPYLYIYTYSTIVYIDCVCVYVNYIYYVNVFAQYRIVTAYYPLIRWGRTSLGFICEPRDSKTTHAMDWYKGQFSPESSHILWEHPWWTRFFLQSREKFPKKAHHWQRFHSAQRTGINKWDEISPITQFVNHYNHIYNQLV